MSEARAMTELLDWIGDVDPSQIGFPFPLDRSLYHKRTEIPFKQTPEGPLHLDAYVPSGVDRAPLVVMIHGGGWHIGGRYQMGLTRWAGYLASAGLAVVSIDYRLAPATSYPDSFRDCVDAIDWAVGHADEIGADPRRVGLWGDSAGGHLALLIGTSQTRDDFPGPRLQCGGERLAAVVAWYPPTDLLPLCRAESALESARVRNFVGVDPEADPDRWREVSPIHQAHAGAPPCMILHGTRDLLVPLSQATSYAKRLSELDAPHELHVVEGGLHGFDRVAPGDHARELIEQSREFLKRNLESGSSPA
jgi:acetyl esterase/lipase